MSSSSVQIADSLRFDILKGFAKCGVKGCGEEVMESDDGCCCCCCSSCRRLDIESEVAFVLDPTTEVAEEVGDKEDDFMIEYKVPVEDNCGCCFEGELEPGERECDLSIGGLAMVVYQRGEGVKERGKEENPWLYAVWVQFIMCSPLLHANC